MKKLFTLLFTLTLVAGFAVSQNDTLAKWSFPTGTPDDSLPDLSTVLNSQMKIFTEGGTSAIDFSKNGETTKSAMASGWDAGTDTKSWQVSVNTTGYQNILLSSVQTAGGTNPGPKDFKLQYKTGVGGTWTDVTNGTVTVANDWTTGVLEDLALPSECDNAELVFVRWIMTSNLDINGTDLIADGKGKIDNIIFTGDVITGVENAGLAEIKVFPNPSNGIITISAPDKITNVSLYNITGKVVFTAVINSVTETIDFSNFAKGMYILKVETVNHEKLIKKIILEN